MAKGVFITFEGGEGVGKTTQINHLQKNLTEAGHDVITTREPGGTKTAEEIRSLLSHKDHGETWTPEAELMLLFAARAMHIKEVIAPALSAGKVILCDRYIDSTRVYQGYLQSVDMDFILDLEQRIVGQYMPDLTLIFDMPADQAMERVNARGARDHYDRGDLAFYEQLRQGFLQIAKDNQPRCVTIDASQDEQNIANDVLAKVKEKLG